MTYYHKHWPLLLLALMLGPLTTHAATDCNAVTEIAKVECESLLQLYHSTDGANWDYNDGWNVTNTPCSWYGVTCENGGVIEINLGYQVGFGNNLTGTLPNFSGLLNLQKLDLYNNQITGTIPGFSGLPNLQELILDYNQLTGTIPDFSELPSLQVLDLSGNQLTGTISNFSGLPNLQELYLYDNQLTGTIPDFSGLPNLQRLYLYDNQLTGTIPDFSGLPNLEWLWLRDNQLTGSIPNLSSLTELDYLDLRNNLFCKDTNINYSEWTIIRSKWQEQLNEFPYCPVAQLSIFPTNGDAPLTVNLDGSASTDTDGTISYYSWWVSDGQSMVTEIPTATMTFEQPGTYTINLGVGDNTGATSTNIAQETITVSKPIIVEPLTVGQAIIIAGPLADDSLFKYSDEFAQRMYRLLVKRGYNDENIHYLNVMAPDINPLDGRPEAERQDYALFNPEQELTAAFAQATANLKVGEQFILYFHGHARPDLAYLADYELTATQLRDLLATVPTGVQQIIILDTCYSGSFLDELSGVADRIVIASTNADTFTFQVIGNSFANEFLSLLEYGESLMGAFRGAEDVILNNPKLFLGQRPWLDDDGDGQFLNDGLRSADVYIETQRLQQSPPPAIKQVHPYITLPDNVGSATLWAQTTPSPEFIHQVRAVLVKPNYQPIEYRGKDTDFSRLELPLVYNPAQERYEIVYDGFCAEPGTWQIQYQAQDTDGAWSEIVTGEVQAQNCTTLATTQMSLNQSRYTTGEAVRLDMTVNGNAQVDLYVAIVFPDGIFITITHPLDFSWPNAVQVYQPAVQITGKKTYSIMDMQLPGGIALGNYSACGILLPTGHDNPIDAIQWIHYHCIGFEVY